MSPTSQQVQDDLDMIMNYKIKLPGMNSKPQNNFVSDERTESAVKAQPDTVDKVQDFVEEDYDGQPQYSNKP